MAAENVTANCCVVGGGPAGIMLGYLLARAGVDVIVLEKHADFFRDFRGDTIHPSTLELLHELNLLDAFLKLPHDKTNKLSAQIGKQVVDIADFSHLPLTCPYIAFTPQWDFLNFITQQAQQFPNFKIKMGTQATDLIFNEGKVIGVTAKNSEGEFSIHAQLVFGTDGRHSIVREKSQLPLTKVGAPMDVLWFRISREKTDPAHTMGRLDHGRMMVMIERGEYWQCGYVIPKGYFEKIQTQGIDALHRDIELIAPELKNRFHEMNTFEKIKLLEVKMNYLKKWYLPGLLCIGDAAHAMSPVGGVGINLAVQDAVAAANILTAAILKNTVTESDLEKVQKRRAFPTKMTQRIQSFIQNRVIKNVFAADGKSMRVPFVIRLFQQIPFLQRIPARMIGMGVRPEHVLRNNAEA